MHEQLKKTLEDLSQAFGKETVVAAAKQVLGITKTGIPAEYLPVVDVNALQGTLQQIEWGISELFKHGSDREQAHQDRGALLAEKTRLETSIKLAEAEAIMKIEGTGKDAYANVGDRKVYLTNDTARDAYRYMASKGERQMLADIEAKIARIDADLLRNREKYDVTVEQVHAARAKAHVQGSLLQQIAGRL